MNHVRQSFAHLLGVAVEPVELDRTGNVVSFGVDVGDGAVVPVRMSQSGGAPLSGDDLHGSTPVQVVGRLTARNGAVEVLVDRQMGHQVSILSASSAPSQRSVSHEPDDASQRPFASDRAYDDDRSGGFEASPPSAEPVSERPRDPPVRSHHAGLGSAPRLGQVASMGSGLQRPRTIGTMPPRIDRPDPEKPVPQRQTHPDQAPRHQSPNPTASDRRSSGDRDGQAAPRRRGLWDMPEADDPILKVPF